MRNFILGVCFFSIFACAATYKEPTIVAQEISSKFMVPKQNVLKSAKRALVSERYQISNSDDSAGIISTAPRNF